MTLRLDQLSSAVEVGKFYLVPTIEAEWSGRWGIWPVIGPKHSDAHCLNFPHHHYHIDPRFMPARAEATRHFWRSVAGAPIMTRSPEKGPAINPHGLPDPAWRRRKCIRHQNPLLEHMLEMASKYPTWRCHFGEWAGRQARHDGRGWVCPHRAVPLADHTAVDGVITCPLHMLRIDAATGVVLAPPKDGGAHDA